MLRGLLATVAFLTVIPVPRRLLDGEPTGPQRMLWWFAPVGALIGGLAALAAWALCPVLPWLTSAAVGIVALAGLSGALHLDGFMDTCDGLGSRTPRERALEIMRDSRVGAFGAIGLACLLLVKFAALAGMSPGKGLAALAIAAILGRAMQVWVMTRFAYARPEGGMGAEFFQAAKAGPYCLQAFGLGILVAVACAGYAGLTAAALAVLIGMAYLPYMIARRLGGHTGDTVGAMSEVTEAVFLLVFAAVA